MQEEAGPWNCSKMNGSNGCTVCVYTQATDLHILNEWILWYLKYYFNEDVAITTIEKHEQVAVRPWPLLWVTMF